MWFSVAPQPVSAAPCCVILSACPREGGESEISAFRQQTVALAEILRFAQNDRL